jgi:hypothetical protein
MLVAKSSVVTTASAENVWQVWTNVKEWPNWDSDVASCTMQGEFKQGAKATLKPTSGPQVTVEITSCVAHKSFVSTSYLPCWTTLVFDHQIRQVQGDKLKITHHVELKGCLAPLFYCILGRSIQKGLPQALQNLAGRAEKL